MRLASFSGTDGVARYGVIVDGGIVDLHARMGDEFPDLRSLLAGPGLVTARSFTSEEPDYPLDGVRFLPVIPRPEKIVCIGLNYEDHRLEAGLPKADHPALFLRTPDSQTGHGSSILRPRESPTLDYEAELAVIIGRPGRRIPETRAHEHIAGYACYNEGSVREWQRHTQQYTAGKNFPSTGAFGPWMVAADEIPSGAPLAITCRLNGTVVQQASTDQMIFSIPRLIEYVSTVTPLTPGDVIVTGTPAGVGSRRDPQLWMKPGDVVEVEIERVGVLRNTIADD
jgi:2-keto-4-pentenoate hydratase/2-oxohepta-3-ene-1,7-dioic acid hydratase in catechol pathway